MTAITFNTLQYVKKTREAGFTEQQAEFQAEEMALVVSEHNNQLATKHDLLLVRQDLEKTKQELENKLSTTAKELEYKLTIRFGLMAVGIITILAAIIKL